MLRLGVLGTMVWDHIYARDGRAAPVEEWGGISYALAAASAACPANWEIVPIIRLGYDLEERARGFLQSIPGLDLESGVHVVPEPNCRVELHYFEAERRTERMIGGVSPWSWDALRPIVEDLDALYINFITGFEMDLEAARMLRLHFQGPIYTDLHSLLLGVGQGGQRVYRPLESWREWLRCFDAIQVNEDELTWLAHAWGDPWHFAAEIVGEDVKLLLLTLGARGAAYFASPSFVDDPLRWREQGLAPTRPLGVPGTVRSAVIPPARTGVDGDPTGCGDVWGATCFCRLLARDRLEDAIRAANQAAARNVEHRGAAGLHLFLQGRIQT